MRITNSGSVGIGTETPLSKLSVSGANSGAPSTTEKGILSVINSAGSQGISFGTYGASAYNMYLQSIDSRSGFNGVSALLLNPIGGNVGIGMINPAVGLSVQGSASYGLIHVISSSANGEASIQFKSSDDIDADSWVVGKNISLTGDQFSIWRGSNRFIINTSGDVGIGTETPNAKLEVKGQFRLSADSGDIGLSFYTGTDYWSQYMKDSDNSLRFYGNGADRVTIDSSGNVGIGTTSPTRAKLVVDGYVAYDNGAFGYLNSAGATGTASGIVNTSIYASARIVCSEFNAISDIRVKSEITPIKNALDIINKLNVVAYNKHIKDSEETMGEVGLIAQELMNVYPLAIRISQGDVPDSSGKWKEVGDFHNVNYQTIFALALKAIQELQIQINELKQNLNNSPITV